MVRRLSCFSSAHTHHKHWKQATAYYPHFKPDIYHCCVTPHLPPRVSHNYTYAARWGYYARRCLSGEFNLAKSFRPSENTTAVSVCWVQGAWERAKKWGDCKFILLSASLIIVSSKLLMLLKLSRIIPQTLRCCGSSQSLGPCQWLMLVFIGPWSSNRP